MRSLFLFILLAFQLSIVSAQCNVVSTAMGSSVTCDGDCNGTITFIYQNTGAPGAPYIVALQNQTTGQWISTTTYTAEAQTILFQNLCPGNYFINVQGSSCQSFATAVVSEPAPITLYANTGNPSPGQNNGTVNLVAQGGTGAMTYSLNGTNYQASSSFSGLAPGTYTGYAQDANGCIETVSFVLNNTGQCNMIVTANPTMASCSGFCDASIWYAFTASGMAPPFVVQLQNMNGQTLQTQTVNGPQGVISGVCAGTYLVQVTDANGCTGSYTVTVISSTPPVVTSVNTTPSAFGSSTGSAVINVSGGTAPYLYSIDGVNFQSGNTFNSLAAGVYILTVTDANGCQTIYCFVIQETQACGVIMTSNPAPVSCYGTSTGSITFAYTNAYGPVSVVLQNPNGSTVQSQTVSGNAGQGVFSSLPAGTYNVIITDAAGCSYSNTVTVSGPNSQLLLTATSVPSSNGMNNGSITATASGGTAPYVYSIGTPGNWQSSNVFSGLAPGVYIIWVQDANGCTSIYTVQLTQITNCQQAINATATSVSCYGMNDGVVNYVFTSSGVGTPFTINLMNANNTIQSQTTANSAGNGVFNSVPAGIYTVQLIGSNGCVSTTQVYVDQPNPIQVTNVDVTNASAGMSNGSAVITVVGGTAPYTFTLNNGTPTTSNNLTGLGAGVYILEVEDANGCMTIYCFVVNETPGCQPLAITATQTQIISCYGSCTGAIVWNYTSGGAAGPYTVTVTNNGNNVFNQTYTISANQGVVTNLCAGQYGVSVTDPNGCVATYNLVINQPAPLNLTATSTFASSGSNNGSITANASGGTGTYLYSIDMNNWQSSNVFTNLSAGTYIVYVQDGNNCTQFYTVIVGNNTNCYLTVTATQGVNSSCPGSCNETINYAYVSQNGVGPFTVTLSDQSGNVLTQTQNSSNAQGTFTGLCGGVYVLTVTSSNGCYGIYTVMVQTPVYMTISYNTTDPTPGLSDGAISMMTTGGTPSYEYSIDDQVSWNSTGNFTNLPAGVYLVYTKDANSCSVITSVKLGQSTASIDEFLGDISVFPNPSKDYVIVQGEQVYDVDLKTMNGQIVSVPVQELTNGKLVNLEGLNSGMYFLTVVKGGISTTIKIVKE